MITEERLKRKLHSCGYWFFIEYYQELMEIARGNNSDNTRQQLIEKLKNKKRPDGKKYEDGGTEWRIGNAIVVFKNKAEMEALAIICDSGKMSIETKEKAMNLIKARG
jgi:hypothetical protein